MNIDKVRLEIEGIGNPDALSPRSLPSIAAIMDSPGRALVPALMMEVGYVKVLNPRSRDGKWSISGSRRGPVYARQAMPIAQRISAVASITADQSDQSSH